MAAEKQSSVSEFQKRVNAEIQDNLDEEIELVLEDDRLADLLSETERLQTHDTKGGRRADRLRAQARSPRRDCPGSRRSLASGIH